MSKRDDLFAAASGDVTPKTETRAERIKRHGLDPHDTAYRDHRYQDPIGMPPPLNPAFIAAQRKIEAVIHRFRSEHPDLDARTAWVAAGASIGIDVDAIAP